MQGWQFLYDVSVTALGVLVGAFFVVLLVWSVRSEPSYTPVIAVFAGWWAVQLTVFVLRSWFGADTCRWLRNPLERLPLRVKFAAVIAGYAAFVPLLILAAREVFFR